MAQGWGYGGQFALWAPALRLTIVTLAQSPHAEQVGDQTAAIMALGAEMVRAIAQNPASGPTTNSADIRGTHGPLRRTRHRPGH